MKYSCIMRKYTWKEAIYEVMRKHGGEMSTTEIAQAILDAGLRSKTATPDYTVAANIYTSIDRLKDKSPFKQLEAGKARFILIPENIPQDKNADKDLTQTEVEETVNKTSIIKAFGMFWDRDGVNWDESSVKLLGEPSNFRGSKNNSDFGKVDFSEQSGIYVLYDHRTIIYVGRATEGTLGARLKAHTKDRLNTRWNRFSWFGTIAIKEDGKLAKESAKETFGMDKIISTMESILIESLEPLQNRKRGDEFDYEFTQVRDDSHISTMLNLLNRRH